MDLTDDQAAMIKKLERDVGAALRQPLVSGSLPSKDEVVDKGYTKAKNADYNYRRSLRDLDHDLYFSGWMDCYDWLSGTDR